MIFLTTVLHVTACLALIIIVLLQAGKGADIGASLGGAGSQTLFGTSGSATLLSKVTTGIAILFMLTSLTLAYTSGKPGTGSLMDRAKTTSAEKSVPADTAKEITPADVPAPAETSEAKASAEQAPAAAKATKEAPAKDTE